MEPGTIVALLVVGFGIVLLLVLLLLLARAPVRRFNRASAQLRVTTAARVGRLRDLRNAIRPRTPVNSREPGRE